VYLYLAKLNDRRQKKRASSALWSQLGKRGRTAKAGTYEHAKG
jgi:hypothetical protein